MQIEAVVLREKVIKGVLARRLRYNEAARELGVTARTIHNYFNRFLQHGSDGLRDRRKGNHHKLTSVEREAIVACKQARPQRSARSIRELLGLKVSAETVRLVLIKHQMNRKSTESYSPFSQ